MLLRFEKKFQKGPSCWLWSGCLNEQGYGHFKVGQRVEKAHRVAWFVYRGDLPTGLCVLHTCDIPPCVNPAHLRLGTNRENVQDRVRKGRSAVLMRNGKIKFTPEKMAEIRAALQAGERTSAVSRRYGIDAGYLSRVRRGLVRCYG